MTDLATYRARIGLFGQKSVRKVPFKDFYKFHSTSSSYNSGKTTFDTCKIILKILSIFILISTTCDTLSPTSKLSSTPCTALPPTRSSSGLSSCAAATTNRCYRSYGKKQTTNFLSRYINGNIASSPRGIRNYHLNFRSLAKKVFEVKNIVKENNPHVFGLSEVELKKKDGYFDETILKVPGYSTLFPKSWAVHGFARVIVYVKNNFEYEQVSELEDDLIQSIWIKGGFKQSKKIYFCHGYREHGSTEDRTITSQSRNLAKFLTQWEEAMVHNSPYEPNEVHVCGDMNLDSLNGKWLQPNYRLISLSRLVQNTCNANNFTQLVKEATRFQYNSVQNTTDISCLDHLYCNFEYRCSKVTITSAGTSDHDMISYTRLSKEPPTPARTIRKRSYKNFSEEKFLEDLAKQDWNEVYECQEVDNAAAVLTRKICFVLNVHAPWIQFQQSKSFSPWLTLETKQLMVQRDMWKQRTNDLALANPDPEASLEEVEAWNQYKSYRNKINNRKKSEETVYKTNKIGENLDSASKTWKTAKMFMNWKTTGTPHQIEVNGKLVTKAHSIATMMNEFFLDKVKKIRESMCETAANLSVCSRIMLNKNTSLSLKHVSLKQVKKLLKDLKSSRSTSIDELDNFAVKLAADIIAQPLHHVIVLSVNQDKFPTGWKYAKVIPLHKKLSQLERKNYRPVALLSPLSKILEKVVYLQVYDYFSRNKIFHPNLHGYRHNRSTQTALLQMYDRWVSAAAAGQVSGVVLLDLSAAFDLVEPEILLKKLRIYGLDESFITWIESYLTHRHQAVWIDHCLSDFLPCEVGVPQGSNLGPLFFLIFYNDLPYTLDCDLDVFADDSTMTETGKDVHEIGEKLTSEASKVTQWMLENKLKLNADKTHLLIVGTQERLRTLPELPRVQMDGVIIEEGQEKSELLLGCTVQSNLKWHSQVENLLSKLKTRLTGLNKLKYLVPFNTRKTITQSIFMSIMVYCLPLFGGCNDTQIKDLQVLQNKAVQIVTHSPPRSSRSAMFDRVEWMTVNQLIVYHTMITVFKIRQNNEPEYFALKLKNDTRTGRIFIPYTDLVLSQNSFLTRGSSAWNGLPANIRSQQKIGIFKKQIRKWILDNIPRFLN